MKYKFNRERDFGVEIEFLRPSNVTMQQIADKVNEALRCLNIECFLEDYNHDTQTYWKLVTDSSVYNTRELYKGHNELVSPRLKGTDGLLQVKTVLRTLRELNCKVNFHCGIHVHHDITDIVTSGASTAKRFLTNLVKFIAKYEHIIYRLVTPSRLDGRKYSTPVREDYFKRNHFDRDSIVDLKEMKKHLKKEVAKDCTTKYGFGSGLSSTRISPNVQTRRGSGLNLRNVWTRGSVEFRYHNGTLNYNKLHAWIVLTQAIVNVVEVRNSVSLSFIKTNKKGFKLFRKALGFIGSPDRDAVIVQANKTTIKRFNELSTIEMDNVRSQNISFSSVRTGINPPVNN